METLEQFQQKTLKELCSSSPSVWQVAIVGIAVADGQIEKSEVALRVCFYTGGRTQ